ncbi:hypothetical protein FHL15_009676 [Xylaria flabelliformis]|uniref:N-acetyltransferase domain-containing protein n=1 Tax=Xylaria flabelliformis TaxID=2512241 RepID=A0A553HN48_9PEZI|nr:hypothetical protein FHL15_009676 [Xylaria flabelliformis]
MPLVVLSAQIRDIEAVYDVYFKAFEHQPVLRILFPGGVYRKAHTEGITHLWNNDVNSYPVKCVDMDTGEIIGMACWDIFWKLGGESTWPKPGGAVWPVHPDHQRRGAGRLLMQWGIDVAEKTGLPIYLESTVPGNSLYEAMGFEQLTHVQIIHKAAITGDPEDTEIPLMVKMPGKAKGMTFERWAEKGYPNAYE